MSTIPVPEAARERRTGLIFGLSAYLLWGVLPLYFKAVAHVSPGEILAHRIIWSLVFLAVLVALWRRWASVRAALASRKVFITLVASALLIAVNWLVYIMAVVSGHVLEGSLGYYLNPLVNILLGVALLGERLSKAQIFATGLAAAGVAVLAVGAASGLWISLTLAASFALYGYLRKIVAVDALEGLSIETAMLAPIALAWILYVDSTGRGGLGSWNWTTIILLVAGGAITAIPLLLFTGAARRLPLSTMGFLQYIAPSLQFLIAVALFGEKLTTAHLVCFGAIWTALAIVTIDGWRRAMRSRRMAVESLA